MVFTWTADAVLNALDAGVVEVASIYNRAYTNLAAHGVGIRIVPAASGVGMARIPTFDLRVAHQMAMEQTIATLNACEHDGELDASTARVLELIVA